MTFNLSFPFQNYKTQLKEFLVSSKFLFFQCVMASDKQYLCTVGKFLVHFEFHTSASPSVLILASILPVCTQLLYLVSLQFECLFVLDGSDSAN